MGELPVFPASTRITNHVQKQITTITERHAPYSDFNYVNLLSWDLETTAEVSMLNDNLVVRFPDYVDSSIFYSFLGDNQVAETAQTLLQAAEESTGRRELRLVPEISVTALKADGSFAVEEDADSHDYVVSLPAIAAKAGTPFKILRNGVNGFEARFGHLTSFEQFDLSDPAFQDAAMAVFLGREALKPHNDHESEAIALLRLFEHQSHIPELSAFGLCVEGALKAFIVSEQLATGWSVGHFWKADTAYRGIYRYLMYRVAEELSAQGYTHMNIEQDLGIAGLKQMKKLLVPVASLCKYTVTDQAA